MSKEMISIGIVIVIKYNMVMKINELKLHKSTVKSCKHNIVEEYIYEHFLKDSTFFNLNNIICC